VHGCVPVPQNHFSVTETKGSVYQAQVTDVARPTTLLVVEVDYLKGGYMLVQNDPDLFNQ